MPWSCRILLRHHQTEKFQCHCSDLMPKLFFIICIDVKAKKNPVTLKAISTLKQIEVTYVSNERNEH